MNNSKFDIEKNLQRAQALCARHEKCSADMRVKLIQWGLSKKEADIIITKLVKDGFINDSRFAEIFVREKNKFNKWGINKISQALKIKGIPAEIITEALSQIEHISEEESLQVLFSKKIKSVKASSDYELKSKLIRFALSRGFKYDDVLKVLSKYSKED